MKKIFFILLVFLIFSKLTALTPEQQLFSEAESRYKAGSFYIAIEFFDNFIEVYPLSSLIADAQFLKGVCLHRLKRYDESLKQFENISSRYRSTRYFPYVNFWAGLTLYNLGDYSRSVDSLNLFLKKPSSIDFETQSLLYKGMGEIFLKSYKDAEASILQLINLSVDQQYTNYAYVLLAYIYYQGSEYENVLTLQDKINPDLLKTPWKNKFLFFLAEAYTQQGEEQKAVVYYENLLTASPDVSSIAFRRLFLAEQKNKDLNEVEKLLQKAEQQFSGSTEYLVDFWVHVGIESFKSGNLELSEHLLNKAWNVRDKQSIAIAVPMYLAQVFIKKGNPDSAASILVEYLKSNKDPDGIIILRLGDIYLKLKDYKKAGDYYEQFASNFPGSDLYSEAAFFNAFARYKSGDIEKAAQISDKNLEVLNSGPYYKEFLRLKAYLLMARGDKIKTIAAFEKYNTRFPLDLPVVLNLLKLQLSEKAYKKIIDETSALFKALPLLSEQDSYTWMFASYLQGISYTALKQYSAAIDSFTRINTVQAAQSGLSEIIPYTLFYTGWDWYKTGEYEKAVLFFIQVLNGYKDHKLYNEALYYTGWCYYNTNLFSDAVKYFSMLLNVVKDPVLAGKTGFYTAKSYVNLDKIQDALKYYQNVFTSYPSSPFADDSLFEYAVIQADSNQADTAAAAFTKLISLYPDSSLAETAAYKIGDTYFKNKRYKEARDAFYQYRAGYPAGKLVDSALYWGGIASYNLKELYGGALLWELLIKNYPKSTFRSDAILRTAGIYTLNGDYGEAIRLYTLLKTDYPADALNADVDKKAKELQYLILGLDDREAELSAVIDKNNGDKTLIGRKTILELAKLYIVKEESAKMTLAFQMIQNIIDKNAEPETAGKAQFLLGEYYSGKKDFVTAGNAFLKGALLNTSDNDFMAMSIFKAADMMKKAGKINDLKQLVTRLSTNFPSSQWTIEGKKLLEDVK